MILPAQLYPGPSLFTKLQWMIKTSIRIKIFKITNPSKWTPGMGPLYFRQHRLEAHQFLNRKNLDSNVTFKIWTSDMDPCCPCSAHVRAMHYVQIHISTHQFWMNLCHRSHEDDVLNTRLKIWRESLSELTKTNWAESGAIKPEIKQIYRAVESWTKKM